MTPEAPGGAPQSRLRGWLLGVWVAVLLSASLYPFNFAPQLWQSHWQALEFDRSIFGHSTRADLVTNLVAYMPLGLLLALLLESRPRWQRMLLALLCGAALSLAVETLQLGIAMRFTSATDFLANSASAAAGAAMALFYSLAPRRGLSARLERPGPVVPLLLAVWFAAQAAPFMPRLRWSRVVAAIADFGDLGLANGALLRHGASLLVLAALLRALLKPRHFWAFFLAAVLGSWLAGLLFLQHSLTAGQCLAFVLALPLILWVRRRPRLAANALSFWFVTGVLLASSLLPADFSTTLQPLQLTLFADSDGFANILARTFLVIGALWLGASSRLGLGRAAGILLAVAVLTELAQAFSASRQPDPTNIVLLLFGVLLLYTVRDVDEAQRPR